MARLTFKRTIVTALLVTIIYAIIRAVLVWETMKAYGISPWVFLIIDIITVPPYVWGIGKMIQGLRGLEQVKMVYIGGVVAIAAFLAPYAYLFIEGRATMPLSTKVVVGTIVVILFTAGPLRGVIIKVKTGKACDES
jgi:hypothetical protein